VVQGHGDLASDYLVDYDFLANEVFEVVLIENEWELEVVVRYSAG
jgi:hypothetical protein